jgi:hypothetical protein
VDPDAVTKLTQAMGAAGWLHRLAPGSLAHDDDLAFDHSVHLIHPQWPCDIDLHHTFPGFLEPAAAVFNQLWARRTSVCVAGREVPCPDFVGQSLVVALHAGRDPGIVTSVQDTRHVVAEVAHRRLEDELAGLARATGSEHTAAEVLEALSVAVPALPEDHRQRVADWHAHQNRTGLAEVWLHDLTQAGWRDKPGVLRRALFPPRDYLVGSSLSGAGRLALAVSWCQRLIRGLRALPAAARSVRSRRNGAR